MQQGDKKLIQSQPNYEQKLRQISFWDYWTVLVFVGWTVKQDLREAKVGYYKSNLSIELLSEKRENRHWGIR